MLLKMLSWKYDCGTGQGVNMIALREGGEKLSNLGERILGRTVARRC